MLVITASLLVCWCLPADENATPTAQEVTIPFGGTDFKQYYTTSRLILEGSNPYDYDKAGKIQRELGEKGATQVPYGPPTSLLPFIPLGWVDFLTAIQIQLGLNVGMLVISCFLWGKMLYPISNTMPLLSCIAVIAWIPCLSLFGMGHVTSWTLLGFTLWCFFQTQNKPWLAGICLALSIIKPHLAFGMVVFAGVYGIRNREWKMLAGFVLTVLVMILATWLIRPSIWHEFLGSIEQSNPTQWYNATLDGWGRFYFGPWFRVVSIAMSVSLLAWIVILAWKGGKNFPETCPLVLALWMAATPYAFSYDYVLLLPGFLMAIGAWLHRSHPYWYVAIAGWMMLDVVYVLKKGQWYEYQFFFIPWGGLALTLFMLTPKATWSKPIPKQEKVPVA
ncbi:MAG: DUF2029 domain-containing protein [Planctomycetia bacterium]|nr:DUF2029 domain-containing protein [Planctomycetia bacterium]